VITQHIANIFITNTVGNYITCLGLLAFYARQHIWYSAYMLSPFRLSVCLSVRLSVRPLDGWITQKRLKLGLWNFHYYDSPIPL